MRSGACIVITVELLPHSSDHVYDSPVPTYGLSTCLSMPSWPAPTIRTCAVTGAGEVALSALIDTVLR